MLTADALYLRPSVINLLEDHGKYLVAVLKDNQPELLSEARTLLPLEEQEPESFETPAAPGKPMLHVRLQEAEGFCTESIHTPLRVVHSHETGIRRKRVAGDWVETPIDSHWWWATTMPHSMADAKTIFHFGHDRWKVENEGFNELCSRWHSGHCYHHHPNSILVLWLIHVHGPRRVLPLLPQAQLEARDTPWTHGHLFWEASRDLLKFRWMVTGSAQ